MKEKNDEYNVRLLVGKNLKRIRSAQNISQLDLAHKAGLAPNFINEIEHCKKGITIRSIAKLSKALNVKPYEFFLPEDMKNDVSHLYINSIKDSIQKAVEEATGPYLK